MYKRFKVTQHHILKNGKKARIMKGRSDSKPKQVKQLL